jgi:hypothetical protein
MKLKLLKAFTLEKFIFGYLSESHFYTLIIYNLDKILWWSDITMSQLLTYFSIVVSVDWKLLEILHGFFAISIIIVVNPVVKHSHEDMENVIPKKAIESLKISDLWTTFSVKKELILQQSTNRFMDSHSPTSKTRNGISSLSCWF